MVVWRPEDIHASTGPHGLDIQAVTSEGGDEDLVIDLELRWLTCIVCDQLADSGSVGAGVIPVEVEGDEYLHVVVSGRLKGVVELRLGVGIHTDVKSKGINTQIFGPLHVRIIISGAGAIRHNADLGRHISSQQDEAAPYYGERILVLIDVP